MSRGINRERQVRKYLEQNGWWTCRAAGSFGDADVVALRAGCQPQLIEVKSTTAGPFHSFGPARRAELLAVAERCGAAPVLVWWPPRKPQQWIHPHQWPKVQEAA